MYRYLQAPNGDYVCPAFVSILQIIKGLKFLISVMSGSLECKCVFYIAITLNYLCINLLQWSNNLFMPTVIIKQASCEDRHYISLLPEYLHMNPFIIYNIDFLYLNNATK